MSTCKQCPHKIGDATERDCAFPDCIGGWEAAFMQAEGRNNDLLDKLANLLLGLGIEPEALDVWLHTTSANFNKLGKIHKTYADYFAAVEENPSTDLVCYKLRALNIFDSMESLTTGTTKRS